MNIQTTIKELESHLKQLEAESIDLNDAVSIYKKAIESAKQLSDEFSQIEKNIKVLDEECNIIIASEEP